MMGRIMLGDHGLATSYGCDLLSEECAHYHAQGMAQLQGMQSSHRTGMAKTEKSQESGAAPLQISYWQS